MHKLEFTGSTLALAWHFGLVDPLLKSCRIFNLGPLKPKAAKKRQIIRFGRAVPTLTSQALRQDDSVNIHKRPMEMAFLAQHSRPRAFCMCHRVKALRRFRLLLASLWMSAEGRKQKVIEASRYRTAARDATASCFPVAHGLHR